MFVPVLIFHLTKPIGLLYTPSHNQMPNHILTAKHNTLDSWIYRAACNFRMKIYASGSDVPLMASSMTHAHSRAFSFDVGAMPGLELISRSHGFRSCDKMKSAPYNSNAFCKHIRHVYSYTRRWSDWFVEFIFGFHSNRTRFIRTPPSYKLLLSR